MRILPHLSCLVLLAGLARADDTIPFRATFNVTNLVFPHPSLPARLEVRVGGAGEASDLGASTCLTTNQYADLTNGRALADYTLTVANGDRLIVHLDAQSIPDPVSPQTKLTFQGGGRIVSGTGRLSGATGEVRCHGWSELQNPQTGQGIGYLEIRAEVPKSVATFVVTTTDDSGPGSLRQAMLDANAMPGTKTIAFNLPGIPPHSIRPPRALPTLSAPVFIDGTTQPGYMDRAIIELDGSTGTQTTRAATGLRIAAGNSIVRGLSISRFGSGPDSSTRAQIVITGRGSNIVEGCSLGCNLDGLAEFADGRDRGFQDGIRIINSTGNLVGGIRAGAGNLISGNVGHGVVIEGGRSNVVAGNLIGSDRSGTVGVPNSSFGVVLSSGTSRNVIGGEQAGSGNLISGNVLGVGIVGSSQNRVVGNLIGPDQTGKAPIQPGLSFLGLEVRQFFGVEIAEGGADNEITRNVLSANAGCGVMLRGTSRNLIVDNRIGVDISGTRALGNEQAGVCLDADPLFNQSAIANVVSNNVVGANGLNGIFLRYPGVRQNVIVGNFVGTDRGGTVDLGHSQFGVAILEGASQNVIGGPSPGEGNTFAFNDWAGVWVGTGNGTSPSTRNRIRGNSIFANGEQGIDLAPDHMSDRGISLNDPGDSDVGPNTYQNFPVLTLAESTGSGMHVRGTLNSGPDTAFHLDFYASMACGPAGHGQGQRYLGTASVTTDAKGDVVFDLALSARVNVGEILTATATSTAAGNTSEFSACLAVVPGPPALTVVREAASGELMITWEALDATWIPEQTLTPGETHSWSVADGTATSSGSQRTLRVSASASQRFYRLRKP